MTPVLTSAPIMMNRPAKNSRVSHSTLAMKSPGLAAGQQHEESGAEQRHHGRLDVEDGVADEAGEDRGQHHAADDQQPTVLDGLPFVEGHDVGHPIRIDAE